MRSDAKFLCLLISPLSRLRGMHAGVSHWTALNGGLEVFRCLLSPLRSHHSKPGRSRAAPKFHYSLYRIGDQCRKARSRSPSSAHGPARLRLGRLVHVTPSPAALGARRCRPAALVPAPRPRSSCGRTRGRPPQPMLTTPGVLWRVRGYLGGRQSRSRVNCRPVSRSGTQCKLPGWRAKRTPLTRSSRSVAMAKANPVSQVRRIAGSGGRTKGNVHQTSPQR